MSEAQKIIDVFMDFSAAIHKADERRRELARLAKNAQRNCGNCDRWMKSSQCPREKNVNGRNQGPSCNDHPCGEFISSASHLDWIAQHARLRSEDRS